MFWFWIWVVVGGGLWMLGVLLFFRCVDVVCGNVNGSFGLNGCLECCCCGWEELCCVFGMYLVYLLRWLCWCGELFFFLWGFFWNDYLCVGWSYEGRWMFECLDLEVLFYVCIVFFEVERMFCVKVDFFLFIFNDLVMLYIMCFSFVGCFVRFDLGCWMFCIL